MIYTTRKEIADAVLNEYDRVLGSHIQQLYSCKAWIFMHDYFDFTILQSYTTIVAAFQRSAGILWVFGFYSNTTAPPLMVVHFLYKFLVRTLYC